MTTSLLKGLNAQQHAAVSAGDGPVLVLAGPGSGKTRVLTHRIAYLIQEMGIHPSAIMAVTFTNKAAAEMRARVEKLLDGKLLGTTVGTFHSICARLLRKEAANTDRRADYLIFDTDDQEALIKQALGELRLDDKKFRPRALLNLISSAKNELITPSQYVGLGYMGEVTTRVYQRYQELLVINNARDFDDLLMDMAILLRDNEFVRARYQQFYEYLLVDEFQDTNAAQYFLVSELGKPQNNVFVVGDEDQAIYAFRGADYRNVAQFRKDFPQAQVILLEQNYRSTQIVLDVARAIIDKNTQRTPKALFTDQQGGAPVTLFEAYSDQEEAEYVIKMLESLQRKEKLDFKDFAVIYRTNAQSRSLEEAFIREGVPYKLVGGIGFYKRREVRDLIAYLRLINNPDDTVSFNRIINVPKRGIGKKSVEDFQVWAAKRRQTYSEALDSLVNGEVSPISAAKKFIEFAHVLHGWRELAEKGDLSAVLDEVIAKTGFWAYLRETSDTQEEALEREENVKEFRGLVAENKNRLLNEFLEDLALVADVDAIKEGADNVTLLTFHAAKGLEYPVVFITGLEEGLLPHFRSIEEPGGVEEERRLLYVGITRAMQHVYLTYAFRRLMYGDSTPGIPSRFLRDLPHGLVEGISAKLQGDNQRMSYQEETTWERPAVPKRVGNGAVRAQITPFAKPATQYHTGQHVQHKVYGDGVVVESVARSGDEEVTVSFKTHGVKRLMASFAKLTILDGK